MYNELKTEIEMEKEKLQKDMDRYLEIDTETDEMLANIAEIAANVGKFLKSPITHQKLLFSKPQKSDWLKALIYITKKHLERLKSTNGATCYAILGPVNMRNLRN